MTVSKVAVIGFADVAGFPVGTVVAKLGLSVTAPDGSVTSQDLAAGTANVSLTFDVAGAYSAHVQAFDATNAALGDGASTSFTVVIAPETITLSLPSTLSIGDA